MTTAVTLGADFSHNGDDGLSTAQSTSWASSAPIPRITLNRPTADTKAGEMAIIGNVDGFSLDYAGEFKFYTPGFAFGYATGVGGAVTQGTSRTTGVTLNKPTGAITLFSAAGSATPATFTVTNSVVDANDTIIVSQKSGTDLYRVLVTAVAAGSFNITFYTTGGTTTEQPVFNFSVISGKAA